MEVLKKMKYRENELERMEGNQKNDLIVFFSDGHKTHFENVEKIQGRKKGRILKVDMIEETVFIIPENVNYFIVDNDVDRGDDRWRE